MKKPFFIVMLIIGLVIFIYLIFINESYQSELKEINFEDNLNVKVEKAYNERGIYILNDTYFLNSATFMIGDNSINVKDDAVWRPKGSEHVPRISDISAPFTISKSKNTNTILVEKDGSKISLLLSN
ncbi:NTF2 fold domain-containing protein [Flavobacterium branchiophilum]|uniref:Uncharacterized protein n=1 Tax=Flavobacterium branchiophilum (strain FL-15) TaxID=1034807 RepID=G2Z569_FLABF|nr:hypothetical protein [Flavobacterium branchiophilum]CCB68575.1 Hypothetical protein FBFL15_0453 [Flavobacterium branchiophilum FL-15]